MIKADTIRARILMSMVFLALSACAATPYTPEDMALQRKVQNAILFAPETTNPNVNIFVRDGVVTLQGSARSGFDRWIAEKTALTVEGVTRVYNYIYVNSRRRR